MFMAIVEILREFLCLFYQPGAHSDALSYALEYAPPCNLLEYL